MIQYTSSDIVSFIGNCLFEHDYTPLGKNTEKDKKGLDESLKYIVAAWLVKSIEEYVVKHPNSNWDSISYSGYTSVFRKLSRRNKKLFHVIQRGRKKLVLKVHTSPEIELCVIRTSKKHFYTHIVMEPRNRENYCGTIDLTPRQIMKLFSKIDEIIAEKKRQQLNYLHDCLSPKLSRKILEGKLTKNMGHSVWYDGSFMYGHEFRLKASSNHDFGLAYITDYLWMPSIYHNVFKNAEKAYDIVIQISKILPENVNFECIHMDDDGVNFTDEEDYPENYAQLCYAMDMIKSYMDSGETLTQEDYEVVLIRSGLKGVIPITEMQSRYETGINLRNSYRSEIENILSGYEGKIVIVQNWHNLIIYTVPSRNWKRECLLKIPYDTDLSFLSQFDKIYNTSSKLIALFDKNKDIETSIGLLPKRIENKI